MIFKIYSPASQEFHTRIATKQMARKPRANTMAKAINTTNDKFYLTRRCENTRLMDDRERRDVASRNAVELQVNEWSGAARRDALQAIWWSAVAPKLSWRGCRRRWGPKRKLGSEAVNGNRHGWCITLFFV